MRQATGPVAWEDESESFPANLALTWWECLVSPDRFFCRVSWEGPFSRPLLYFLMVAIMAALLGLFWFVWSPWGGTEYFGVTLEFQLLSFFLTPFALLLSLGLISLAQHLLVVLLAPERQGLGATATVLCYASGVGLVKAFVPPALGMAGFASGALRTSYLLFYVTLFAVVLAWYVIVQMAGLREAHSITTGRAAAIVLLPMAIGLVLTVVLAVVVVALGVLADLPV